VGDDGRVVQLDQPGGFVLRSTSRALAESNWTLAAGARRRGSPADADILESTAVAASAPLRTGLLSRLTVRLTNVELAGFEVAGGAQTLDGTTLTVRRDRRDGLAPGYALPASGELRARFARELAAEPLLQAGAPEIVALARRVGGGSRDPVVVAERLTRWLHDSLRKDITIGVPSALQTLASRNGDCNEHTQLYLALARASGLPARGAAGLARVGKKFYYHAWPEVYLGRWVAVDPTFGEFPADAGHLRFVTGGLGRQAELLRLIGTLGIDVVESR
jgi:transglutaminase-like putative cysteine protease